MAHATPWSDFESVAPDLARLGRELFDRHQLCMLGTLRHDGSPRISPCEMDYAAGELLMGMMWRSPKAIDLLRDPRCVLHSCTTDKAGTEGDFKLYGHATDVTESALLDAYVTAIKERTDWTPPQPVHVFAIRITSAGYVVFGDQREWMTWDPDRGVRKGQQREV